VINVIFNTVNPLPIVCRDREKLTMNAGKQQLLESYLFRIIWGEQYENYQYRVDFSFELLIIKVFEITR
jgi:hypothetical protein